jgi:hypothetical protein
MTYIDFRRLYMAVCRDAECTQPEVVEISGCACEPPSLAVTAGGNPVVSYSDDHGVAVFNCVDPTCGEGTAISPGTAIPKRPDPIPEGEGGWIQTSPAEAGFEGALMLSGLTSTRFGLFASGNVCEATFACIERGWISADGRVWESFAAPSGFDADRVVEGGPGLVALSTFDAETLEPGGDPVDSAVYGSTNGRVWEQLHFFGTRLPVDGDGFEGLYVADVFAGSDRLVAYGFEAGTGLVIWTSFDGSSWERVSPSGGGYFGSTPLPSRVVHGMASVGDRYFMWGEMWSGAGEPFDVEIAVWRSDDLADWEYLALPTDGSPTGLIRSGTAWTAGLLIRGLLCEEGGSCSTDTETFWVTTDGTVWDLFAGDTSVFHEWGGEIFPMGSQLGVFTDDERGRALMDFDRRSDVELLRRRRSGDPGVRLHRRNLRRPRQHGRRSRHILDLDPGRVST